MYSGLFSGKKARRQRELVCMSMKHAASLMGIYACALKDWERGKHAPTIEQVDRMAQVYKCHAIDLME